MARDQLVNDMSGSGTKLKNRPVSFVAVDFTDEAQLQTAIDRTHAAALVAMPNTSPAVVKSMWELSQDNQLYALAFEASSSSSPSGW